MIIVLFRSRLREDTAGYAEMAAEMLDLAKGMEGFIDTKSYRADDGERLSVIWWESEETMSAWRDHARHKVAQRLGREQWYDWYSLEVSEVIRSKQFDARARRE